MSKQILILNSSPRKNGNTEHLADALIQGAKQAGHTTVKFNLREMNLKPCVGCYGCAEKKGNPCVQKDDMQNIYDAFDRSDTIVFASPLYWWTVTAQMKIVIDRLFAIAAANDVHMPSRDVALLIAAEDPSTENFEQIISYYRTCLVSNIRWNDRGMVLAGGVDKPGAVANTPFLEEAVKLGASL